jgi:hypothetical protein
MVRLEGLGQLKRPQENYRDKKKDMAEKVIISNTSILISSFKKN